MEQLKVMWHGELVGYLIDARPDMWYLEGQWNPAPNSHADKFLSRAATLDARAFMAGKQRGVVVELHEDTSPQTPPILAVVISPPAQTLFVRRIFDPKAVEMVRAWEKEEV